MPTIRLANGLLMPQMGMGTYDMTNDTVLEQRVIDAIDIGYRHIDTAHVYQNERIIRQSIEETVRREQNQKRRSVRYHQSVEHSPQKE